MAVLQEPVRIADKHESYVDQQIDRASRRIRTHDVGVAVLGLALGTLGYALAVVLLDRWLNLPSIVRQAGLIGYLIAAATYTVVILSRPFRRQVNPYYAARQVERAIPQAKNSVVNWLDLRDEPLPATIKTALGARAADDLNKADLDGALHDGRIGWLGAIVAGLCFTALVLLFVLRPNQFFSLIGRAFAPFTSTAIARQTGLTLLQPASGDITVPVNHAVDFRVSVQGKNPLPGSDDSVRLQLKYNPADPVWEERRLEPSPRDPREWTVRVPSVAVQNGFVYQIVGGDAATPEHRVSVRSSPLIDGFDVVYRFRPYLRYRDQADTKPNLEGLRGTEVALTVRTNRMIREGWLRFDKIEGQPEAPSIARELVAELPNSLRFRFTLEKSGQYRVNFKSIEGDENQDPIAYSIRVLTDQAPQIDITRAAPEGLATNGTLQLEGKASDDFGLTKLRLCMQLLESDKDTQPARLADKSFRDGKSFKFDDGTYPRALDYKESIALEQLRARGGLKLELKAGKIIEYWLEGEDNCDYPQPNLGRSKTHRVTLGDPKAEDEKKAANEQANAEKREFDDKQDKDLNNENAAKNAANENPQKPEQGDPKPQDDNKKPDQPPEDQKPQDNQPKDPNQKAEEDKARDTADKLKEKLNQKNEEAKQPKGENKPDPPNNDQQPPNPDAGKKGESKPDDKKPNQPQNSPQGEAKPDPKPQPGNEGKGESKPEGNLEAPPQPGEAKPEPQGKDGNKPNDPNAKPEPQNKDASKPNDPNAKPNPQNKDASKPNDPNAKPEPQNKDASKPNDPNAKPEPQNKDAGKPEPGEAKASPKPDEPKPGESKSEAPKDGSQPGECKDCKDEGVGGAGNRNASKGQETKVGPQNDPTQNDPQAKPDANQKGKEGPAAKTPSGQPDKGPAPPDAEVRPGEPKDRGQPEPAPGKGEGKPDPNRPAQPGGSDEKGNLQDAPKGAAPGPKPKEDPKSDGTPGSAEPKKTGEPGAKKSADEMVKQASELAKKLAEQAKDLKNASPADPKAAEELGKKLAESAAEQKKLAEALRNADPKLKKELADNLNKLREEMKKNEAGQPQGEQKPSDVIDELANELGKQPDQGQPSDERAKPGDPNTTGGGSGDGSNVRERPIGDRSQQTPEAGPGSKPDPRNAARAGEMLLEEFRKKVDRKMLEELKMTEAEYAEFLRSYEDMVRRQKAAVAAADKADRQRGAASGGSGINSGAKRIESGKDKGDLNRGGAALAPPEMRDGYKGFTEDVSKSGTKPKDQK